MVMMRTRTSIPLISIRNHDADGDDVMMMMMMVMMTMMKMMKMRTRMYLAEPRETILY